jgi:hypothetical protein
MAMPEVPEDVLNGLNELLKLDEAWIRKRKFIVHQTIYDIR